ncbi:MAG: (Fe-S)-binding protein, partial [Calditrichota bacterium]
MPKPIKVSDISKPGQQLAHIRIGELMPLPAPYDKIEEQPGWKVLTQTTRDAVEASLDDTIAVGIPKPKTKQEEDALVESFLSGLHKLFTKENNWTFLQ